MPSLPPGALARIAPFAVYVLALALGRLLFPGGDLPLGFYPLIVATTAAALWWFRRDYAELREPLAVAPRELLLAVAVGLAVLAVWVGVDTPLLRLADNDGYRPVGGGGEILWPWVALRIAGSALVVPVMEELFWRSFIMRWLDTREFLGLAPGLVSWRSLVIAAIPFALEHAEIFAGFVAGIAYSWLYRSTGRLWPAIVAHGVTNLGLGLWVVATGDWRYW